MENVKEIISKDKLYKVEIVKRADGLFSIETFRWEDEWGECWSRTTRGLLLIDTFEHAMEIAVEEFRNITGEDIIM